MTKSYREPMYKFLWVIVLQIVVTWVHCVPDQGKWDFEFIQNDNIVAIPKSLYAGSNIYIQITCDSETESHIMIQWILTESLCWEDYLNLGESMIARLQLESVRDGNSYVGSPNLTYACSDQIILDEVQEPINNPTQKGDENSDKKTVISGDISVVYNNNENKKIQFQKKHTDKKRPVYTVTKDSVYLLTLHVELKEPLESSDQNKFRVNAHIEMKSTYGYLSAADWPLLPFYGAMCLVYVIFGLVWLVVSFLQWRDLLRIQFWIGAVILLGMLEKAMFYAEYQNVNSTGEPSMQTGCLIAEWVSCAKRTLARMLVIIVSLGFGIVKPRLGSHLHKIIVVGLVYFFIAAWESYLRVMKPKSIHPVTIDLLLASVPLALLDSIISWWIVSNLVQTTRTLRLRRNIVKLALYNHFTNTLVVAIVASIIFMLYSTKTHMITNCLTDWKKLWLDDAFWHLLFSIVLLVIMILWRPTNNNQRYAFSPLLDAPDDEDDEDIEQFVSDVYGVKMRGVSNSNASDSPRHKISTNSAEDDLKWVEENIPSSIIDTALPILDSDEEIMSTKFEISKMA